MTDHCRSEKPRPRTFWRWRRVRYGADIRLHPTLGLRGLPLDCAAKVGYKDKTHPAPKPDGVAVPLFAVIDREQDLREAIARIGFPAVLKAANLGGSFNIRKAVQIAQGVGLAEIMIKVYLGEPVANWAAKKGKHAGIVFFHKLKYDSGSWA